MFSLFTFVFTLLLRPRVGSSRTTLGQLKTKAEALMFHITAEAKGTFVIRYGERSLRSRLRARQGKGGKK